MNMSYNDQRFWDQMFWVLIVIIALGIGATWRYTEDWGLRAISVSVYSLIQGFYTEIKIQMLRDRLEYK